MNGIWIFFVCLCNYFKLYGLIYFNFFGFCGFSRFFGWNNVAVRFFRETLWHEIFSCYQIPFFRGNFFFGRDIFFGGVIFFGKGNDGDGGGGNNFNIKRLISDIGRSIWQHFCFNSNRAQNRIPWKIISDIQFWTFIYSFLLRIGEEMCKIVKNW